MEARSSSRRMDLSPTRSSKRRLLIKRSWSKDETKLSSLQPPMPIPPSKSQSASSVENHPTISQRADQATRQALSTNNKTDHLRAQHAHENAATYCKSVGDNKQADRHAKQAKLHKVSIPSASASSSTSSASENPLNSWVRAHSTSSSNSGSSDS